MQVEKGPVARRMLEMCAAAQAKGSHSPTSGLPQERAAVRKCAWAYNYLGRFTRLKLKKNNNKN